MTAREAALKALYDIEFNGAYSNMAVKGMLSHEQGMSKPDKTLFTALVYGVTDKKLTLDYYIRCFSKIKLKKLSKYILLILRMGIYQLVFMDKIPQSAAVNESVKLAKRYGHSASAGFVNGVLRSAAGNEIEYPSEQNEYLSVKYSFPLWLCDKWIEEFGFDFAESMMRAFEENKKITLRPNSLKITAKELAEMLSDEGIKAEVLGNAVVTDGFDIEHSRLYCKGYFTAQDTAAMKAAETLSPQSGEYIIDMCSAPGGKTTHIAEIMKNKGRISAFDIYEHKTELVRKNAERLGISIIDASVRDASEYDGKLKNTADRVLCDVPCSGLGIIGRKPDIKWNRSEETDITELQKKILENGAEYLKNGGTLVYSTCTVEKSENEEVTAEFLKTHKNFEKVCEKTFYPHTDGTDGFYICKMKKQGY